MDRIGSSYPEAKNPHYDNKHSEVIWRTQSLPKTINQGRIYKDIMTSIGLDSLNDSMESKREENRELNQIASTCKYSHWD
jgi:hypothetical protein